MVKTPSFMPPGMPNNEKYIPNLINALPREILYKILFLCDQTYDTIRDSNSCQGGRRHSIGLGCRSRVFERVCRLWRTCTVAGMIPSTPLSEIQLTDGQFLQIIADQCQFSPRCLMTSESEYSILQGYHTITIIYNRPYQGIVRRSLDTPLQERGPDLQIPSPKQLNLVITHERTVDISEVLRHFRTSRRGIQDNLHEANLASHETIDEDNNISINVWSGRLVSVSWSNVSSDLPISLRIPGFSRMDLYINDWTHPDSINDIPWIFGQLCQNARPSILGFHLLSPHGSALTDGWHIQKPCPFRNNTLLRKIHVSGLSSDGFLRLLQCSATMIWCVREIKITLPTLDSTHLAQGCFWDWRVFDKETWPVITCGPEDVDRGLPMDDGLQDVVTFPKLELRRLVDGVIHQVKKARMKACCQIAYFGPDFQVEEGMNAGIGHDIERYAGRSLRWMSLMLIEVEGDLMGDARLEFDRLKQNQLRPSLVASSRLRY